jgi:hypothetical protein
LDYIKRRQKQWEKKWRHEADLEAKKEAERIALMEAKARKKEETAARKKLLQEQQEAERLNQKHIQAKEKLAENKWNEQLDTLLGQLNRRKQEDEKLEEIRIIIQNRQPSLQELDWSSWLSSPLNQRLADLDFDQAAEMFKHDNLMAKRRHGTRAKGRTPNGVLSFSGNTGDASRSYATTNFNPDDYDLNLGFTVSYWVRPDEVGNTMFAFGRKHNNNQRFVFGINRMRQSYFGIGKNKTTTAWVNMDTPVEESLLVASGQYWNLKTDGTWYHMAVTYDDRSDTSSGADRKIYVNGVLRQTDTFNWDATGGSTGGMYFGARNLTDSWNNGWACALSEVAIFNTAKDADWVETVYDTNGPKRPRTRNKFDLRNQSGLVGYWKFNEGSGTTVTDHSGNGNHATFGAISGGTTAHPTWDSSPFSNS